MLWGLALACGGLWLASSSALAEELPEEELFRDRVAPILEKHCVDCHGEDDPEAGLNLTTRDGALFGSLSGRILVPGRPQASLVAQLVAKNGTPHMPPKGQLADEEIATLAGWIEKLQGAVLPERPLAASGGDHWAYQPARRATPPAVKQADWARSPIDPFVLARLEEKGLAPSPRAPKAQLLRRVYFDVIGLPPTPEEVAAFEADEAPDAWERVVDRLLASPHYGERWGRHWLDLARYADSSGFHDDIDRPHAWRYRDYVIASLNADQPYARFVREQLAGDELAPHDPAALAATGFGRHGPSNENNMGPEQEKYRLDQLDDVLSTTALVFLGQTIGCARCHDHKFDPISQVEYYRFLAVFNNTVKKDVPLSPEGVPDWKAKPAKDQPAVMVLTETSAKPKPTFLLWRGEAQNRGEEVSPGVPSAMTHGDWPFSAPEPGDTTTGRRRQLAEWIVAPENPLTYRVLANRLWQHHFGRGLVATPSNFGTSGESPSHPELLDWLSLELIEHEGRLKPLHRLLLTSAAYQQSSAHRADGAEVDPANRLLWRMNKKRLEAEALRDATLAVAGTLNGAHGGPGVKPRIPEPLLVASQRNKWPVVKQEGPEHWRRSVYIYVKRQLALPMLELFDAPNSAQTCDRRDASVVPTQALVLMNDDFGQQQADFFADRVRASAGDDPAAQTARALSLALAREPAPQRVSAGAAFLDQQRQWHGAQGRAEQEAARLALVDLCHVLLNCNEFLYLD